MFKTISSDEQQPKGKLQTVQSYTSKLTNYQIGCKEWDSQWKTSNSLFHNQKAPEKNFVIDKASTRKTQWTVGSKELQGKGNNFQSEKMKQYPDYPGHIKAKPLLSKQDLTKHNYNIGQDKNYFDTTNGDFAKTRQNTQLPNIEFKKDRVRYDIIQNQDINQKDLHKKASCFDFYNPQKDKGRVTTDHSNIPRMGDRRVDPITGRKLKF